MVKKIVCEYTDKECEFWEQNKENNLGECLAIFPEQCPYNTKEDIDVIKESQIRIVK